MVENFVFMFSRTIVMIIATLIFAWVSFKRRALISWLFAYISATISEVLRLISQDRFDMYELIGFSFSGLSVLLFIIAVSYDYYHTFSKSSKKQTFSIALLALGQQIITSGLYIIIGFLLLIALFLIIKIYFEKRTPTYAFMIFILVTGFIQLIAGILRDGGLPGAEEFYQFATIVTVTILLVTGIVAFIENKLVTSEKKYRLAYTRAEFYKDLFVHDINNILQNLEFSLEFISQEMKRYNTEGQVNELIRLAKSQVNRGAELGVNVRKLSDLELGKIKNSSVQVCEILGNTIKYVKTRFLEKKMSFSINSKEKHVIGYANEILYDVFRIILNNAIRYNDNPEIKVTIKISKQSKEGINYIRMEFRDNGIGMPDKMKESIFYKIYERPKTLKRIGLGLLLVREVIHSFKGIIWAEDRIKGDHKKGTNIIILIPETL